tara:strand:- start:2105 stop:2395 length:291 start_codon:yes stop_codon:yes gene_type:complete
MGASGTSGKAGAVGVGKDAVDSRPVGGESCAEEGMAAKDAGVLGMSGIQSIVEKVRAHSRQPAWLRLLRAILKYGWGRVLGAKKAWGSMGVGKGDR